MSSSGADRCIYTPAPYREDRFSARVFGSRVERRQHVLSYHIIAPRVIVDTPLVVKTQRHQQLKTMLHVKPWQYRSTGRWRMKDLTCIKRSVSREQGQSITEGGRHQNWYRLQPKARFRG